MLQPRHSASNDNSTGVLDLPWVGCRESHSNPTPWILALCEGLDDLPLVAHCAACGALLGTECCMGEGENGSDWQSPN